MNHLRGLPSRRVATVKVRATRAPAAANAGATAAAGNVDPKLLPAVERFADLLLADLLKNPEKWR